MDQGIQNLISLEEAVEHLGTSRPTFYRWLRSGKIKGHKVGRQWRFTREDLDRYAKGESPKISLRADIQPLINELEKQLLELGGSLNSEAVQTERACLLICALADKMQASDIHIDSFPVDFQSGDSTFLRFRVAGSLHEISKIDTRLLPSLIEQWKIFCNCDPREVDLPQNGSFVLNQESTDGGGSMEMQISFFPVRNGESMTARIIRAKNVEHCTIDNIGMSEDDKKLLLNHAESGSGLIAFTGITGTGKTSTVYATIRQIASKELKFITLENPREAALPFTIQAAISPKDGFSYSAGIKSALRCDVDGLFVSEIPDEETLRLALQTGMTGHLVLTQLHAPDTVRAALRMQKLIGDGTLVIEGTKLIVAQRLIRKLCVDCSVPLDLNDPEKQLYSLAVKKAHPFAFEKGFKKPVGCQKCAQTGFRGRTAIYELLEMTNEFSSGLLNGLNEDELWDLAIAQGTKPLLVSALEMAGKGLMYFPEICHIFGVKN